MPQDLGGVHEADVIFRDPGGLNGELWHVMAIGISNQGTYDEHSLLRMTRLKVELGV
ncbi:MAG TPA: hypothetical protein PLK06_04280 [bacterium]|nr:hypothetical protein [bacterium]